MRFTAPMIVALALAGCHEQPEATPTDPVQFQNTDEARAWDLYVAGRVAYYNSGSDDCASWADEMLRLRRERMP